jgi:hypothetical protein
MQRTLELEGYMYRGGVVLVPEEAVLDTQEEQGVLLDLAKSLHLEDLETLRHHVELSAEHYQQGKWDDSISNSRKVLEAVLLQVAVRHSQVTRGADLTPEAIGRPVRIRDYLESAGLLEQKEKEAIAKCYGLLSETGGHPYIAEKDQARLMRHLALTFSQFTLLRLQGALREHAG